MKILTCANQKGGVGKTTSAIALAGLLAERNQRVLLVDLDPHGSLSHYVDWFDEKTHGGSFKLFATAAQHSYCALKKLCDPTHIDKIDIMSASLSLATLDRRSSDKYGFGLILKRALAHLANDYEFAIIDCPPMIGVLMVNALAACDQLIIPVQTESLALHGLSQMLATVQMIEQSKKISLKSLIVPTLFDGRTSACKQVLGDLKQRYTNQLWQGFIPLDTKLREAAQHRIAPSLYAPKSKGVQAYKQLLRSVLKSILYTSSDAIHYSQDA